MARDRTVLQTIRYHKSKKKKIISENVRQEFGLMAKCHELVAKALGQAGTNRGEPSMSIESHLEQLEKKHLALEIELADAILHPSVDDLKIAEIKRRKLVLKDEMEKLRAGRTTH